MGQQGAGSSRTPHGLALPRDCSALEDHLQSESARGRATPDRILADMDPLQRVTREGYLLSTITPPTLVFAALITRSLGTSHEEGADMNAGTGPSLRAQRRK